MVQITFADSIQRHVPTPPVEVHGGLLRDVFAGVFATRERLRGYILDDQGSLRLHLAVFMTASRSWIQRGCPMMCPTTPTST